MNRGIAVLITGMAALICMSFQQKPVEQASMPAVSQGSNQISLQNKMFPTSKDYAEADKMGKELLKKYDVQYGQAVRFPYKDYVFETHGAAAITELAEARAKYPEWPIPEKLGRYQFADFTLYPRRTTRVFSDTASLSSTDSIEVVTDKAEEGYYICYLDKFSQMQIHVIPMPDNAEHQGFPGRDEYVAWPEHPNAYVWPREKSSSSGKTEIDMTRFEFLWITPGDNGQYIFEIQKVVGYDCLADGSHSSLSAEEASEIYEAVQKNFPNPVNS